MKDEVQGSAVIPLRLPGGTEENRESLEGI
jgi:hypothetical protein